MKNNSLTFPLDNPKQFCIFVPNSSGVFACFKQNTNRETRLRGGLEWGRPAKIKRIQLSPNFFPVDKLMVRSYLMGLHWRFNLLIQTDYVQKIIEGV